MNNKTLNNKILKKHNIKYKIEKYHKSWNKTALPNIRETWELFLPLSSTYFEEEQNNEYNQGDDQEE